ncbi:MAG: hypothetical protein ACYDAZ_06780 [Thermoplasmataceae archaeon]
MSTGICIPVPGTGIDRILTAVKEKRIDCRVSGIIADRKYPALVMVPDS